MDMLATPLAVEPPKANPEALKALGVLLWAKFASYERDRKLSELQWARNARQYKGLYDQDIEKNLDPNRSRAYPKLTRVKVVSMLSRMMNLLFQADDKCWGIAPSPVPDLEQADLQAILDKLLDAAQGGAVDDDEIEQEIREFAKKRAGKLELEIEDQLSELGGNSKVSFTQLCRKVLQSGIMYGMGVMKGPFVKKQQLRKWQKDASGRLIAVPYDAFRPQFEFVPIWDYYPDMSARYLHQMEGQFERHVMSKHQVMMLKKRPDFFPDQVDEIIRLNPNGNYTRKAFETELRAMGIQMQITDVERNKFEILSWSGHVSGKDLKAAGVAVPEDKLNEDLLAEVWFSNNVVVKADLDPWSELETDGEMPMYHRFVFEEDESTIMGNGLPNIMRDSQMSVCATTRMTLDNASILRVFEMNTELLSLNQDTTAITPDKIFYREDTSAATAQIPAIRTIELPIKVRELQDLVQMFQGFADQETFVNPANGGDMQKGPSEPFRTAAGASMIQGNAALPFKDVVRNFDRFTESVIGALIVFNKNFNPDPLLQGDFKPIARGATSLIAKEVLGIQLDNFATTLTDGEKQYVNFRELARARARVRDLIVEDIVVDDAKADAIDAQAAQAAQAQQATQQKLVEAQIRQILGDTLKSISQGGKNDAAAQAHIAKVVLDAMEAGLPVDGILKALSTGAQVNGQQAETGGAGVAPEGAAPEAGPADQGPMQAAGAPGGEMQNATGGMPAG